MPFLEKTSIRALDHLKKKVPEGEKSEETSTAEGWYEPHVEQVAVLHILNGIVGYNSW